jgi:hypothetical protein
MKEENMHDALRTISLWFTTADSVESLLFQDRLHRSKSPNMRYASEDIHKKSRRELADNYLADSEFAKPFHDFRHIRRESPHFPA